jgi:signal transduction histidine kinase
VRDLGAAAAIKAECQNFARQHRIPAHFRNEGIGDLPEQTGLTLFRILQEALHNIAKHAHTTAVHVRLDRVEDCVCLRIQDSGVGFDVARAPARLGLASMRERVALARGNLTIQSSPGRGTLVEAVVPAPAALEPNHIA